MTALLEGELAVRARTVLDALSRSLVRSPIDGEPWLASGTAGLALANAHLDAPFPDRGHGDAAGALLQHAIDAIGTRRARPWLVQGTAGIGWTVAHLTRDDPDPSDVGAAFDVALERLLAPPGRKSLEYMHGVAGLAIYAAERSSRLLLERIGSELATHAIRDAEGARWSSEDPDDGINLGLAHGTPGIVAGLALVVRAGIDHRALLRDACRFVLAQRLPAAFPRTTAKAHVPARIAWCYGDPGVAWALRVAGTALADEAIVERADAILREAARFPHRGAEVDEMGFCHGAMGLAHVFHRVYLATNDALFADAARMWIDRGLAMSPSDEGLITGAAGVALVLATALDLADTSWDAPLMFT